MTYHHLFSKDQSIKLWDLRRFSSKDAVDATKMAVRNQNWDYRWQGVPRRRKQCNLSNIISAPNNLLKLK